MKYLLGIDIGGTKCAVTLASYPDIKFLYTNKFSTLSQRGYNAVIDEILTAAMNIIEKNNIDYNDILSCGVSCGGPLDSDKGIIMSPPNLPDWDNIPLKQIIEERLGIKAKVRNDADACALAEWNFGAGRGTKNMIFLTFGTGMGAGLILNGKLYSGTSGNAGEVGHIRIAESGPYGYGKYGSFEGFCSGGGIARFAEELYNEYTDITTLKHDELTAENIAKAARNGDRFAVNIYKKTGYMLGKGLSVLIDILNPEMIVIGSIFERSSDLMIEEMNKAVNEEALKINSSVCKIVPAELGNEIGNYAAIGVAKEAADSNE